MTPAPATYSPAERFRAALEHLPLIAILRGLKCTDAAQIGSALHDAGFRLIEVPLNSPEPLRSIATLARSLPDCVIGAGTVLSEDEVKSVHDAGGSLVVAPNFDPEVVAESIRRGLPAIPGVATPSEAFSAIRAGAAALKLFPAEGLGPEVLKAWRAVIPAHIPVLPVGGITIEKMPAYVAAGASGFGLGSSLYRPADDATAVHQRACAFVEAWRAAIGR